MSLLERIARDAPAGRRLLWVTSPFMATVCLLLLLSAVSVSMLSAARAFVGGESLWAKGEKEAAYFLNRYAQTRDEADYRRFLDNIAVPLGDRKARLALSRAEPDLEAARQGLLEGRNHADDIPGMIRLYRWFGDVSIMADAIAIWRAADEHIVELTEVAAQLHQRIVGAGATDDELRPLVDRVNAISRLLTPMESEFSRTLGEASRRTEAILLLTMLVLSCTLILLATALSRRMDLRNASTERALRQSEERLALAMSGSNDGMWDWDLRTGAAYFSPRTLELLGYREGELPAGGDLMLSLLHEHDRAAFRGALREHLRGNRPFDLEFRLLGGDGAYRWFHSRGKSVREADGRAVRMAGSITDITDRKRAEDRLTQMAQFDALTGLPNRGVYLDRLHQMLQRARRDAMPVAVLFVDLDRFKIVNDTLGHGAGDEVLLQAAQRLLGCVRAGDTVGRLGGDEFAVALGGLSRADDAGPVAHKIVEALSLPLDAAGRQVYVSASVGISMFPADGADPETLLRHADTAMYRVKAAGRNGHQFYRAQMNERAVERLSAETALRTALDRGEFELHYQPKVALASGRPCGFEALLRWRHPERGLVAPADFIDILEDNGLIVPVGEWVLKTACAQLAAWQREGLQPLPVAVNLSPRQFRQRELDGVVGRLLADAAVGPGLLEIELTESTLMDDPEAAVHTLRAMKSAGIRLALDDFGTGYSSLANLKRFPLDALKIDREFIRDVATDADGAAITLAVIQLARSLKLKVVAEGVETAAQLAFLQRHGCDEGQGFHLARPMAAEDCARLLAEGARPPPLREPVAPC